MMLHQDGSRHEWTPGRQWDLIVTLDDATSGVCSAFFVAEEGAMSRFRALHEVTGARGLFCSLHTDRGSHCFHTPEADGKVGKDAPTRVGRALRQLGIEHTPACSPEAEGSAFVPFTGTLDDILRIHEERTVSDDDTVRCRGRCLQLQADRQRHHYVKAKVRVHEYPDRTLAVFHGPGRLARYQADGQPFEIQTRKAA